MPRLIVKKWREFQHYKDRSPPWIKLQKSLLDDYDFHRLPLASKALAPLIWLLASESDDGSVDSDVVKIAFRIRWSDKDVSAGLTPLIKQGFLIDASGALASCKQDACSEAEGETEREVEAEESAAKPRPLRKCPESFIVTQALFDWAEKKVPNVDVATATEAFRDHTFNRAITDWPGAWRNWMRREKPASGRRLTKYEESMAELDRRSAQRDTAAARPPLAALGSDLWPQIRGPVRTITERSVDGGDDANDGGSGEVRIPKTG